MTEYRHARLFRGARQQQATTSSPRMVGFAAPAPCAVGFWDVSLLLGELPQLIERIAPNTANCSVFNVTAATPAGIVRRGDGEPVVVVEHLAPQVERVAGELGLSRLVAFVGHPLSKESLAGVYQNGPVVIVSLVGLWREYRGSRAVCRGALFRALPMLPEAVAAAIRRSLRGRQGE
jgi:hypothetical protein